jgi:hypothetical protein
VRLLLFGPADAKVHFLLAWLAESGDPQNGSNQRPI